MSTRDGEVRSSIESIHLTDSFTDIRPYFHGVCPDLNLSEFLTPIE